MALRVGPKGLEDDGLTDRRRLRLRVMDSTRLLPKDLENVFGLSLVRGTTDSELERTRGIRLFN